MSDTTNPAALLAWCEQHLQSSKEMAQRHLGFSGEVAKWEAIAAIVRAHQTLEAEIEQRRIPNETEENSRTYNMALADVLRLLAARGAQR